MSNLYDPDIDSVQFNLYRKFKQNLAQKNKIGPLFKKKQKSHYLIIEYTKIFGKNKFCEHKISDEQLHTITDQELVAKLRSEKSSNSDYFLLNRCRYKNCFFSCDKSLARHSDALMFHERDLTSQVKAIKGHKDYENVHSKLFNFDRDASQVWILWNDEANFFPDALDSFHFNWTISYNSMSEASFCTYGCLTKSDLEIGSSNFDKFVLDQFSRRKNKILWFVSNCAAKKRLKVVEKLSLYNNIEIYGKCNHYIKNNFENISLIEFGDEKCAKGSDCEKNTFEGSKFYFAFENQNCTDYITEKFWRSLDFNLIPIVFQPNKEYYEKIAPANSYIHFADFDYDSKKLSQYLNLVSKNLKIYEKFFEWKKYYKIVYQANYVEQLRFCEICEKLNNLDHQLYYDKISNWFNSQCFR
ncbi:alpha-(1-3)-fucosyltransferase C-like [Brachionus plicatilis]|uniref:Fucosyltransferase n=1 Tax=Brachionus plicatilis TaxID=10195 RepID=A0A3M7S599_BRAPC|nr:alpha-(1-3)-fucosyltransferase C-like [Brachionus plicatilis]